MRIDGQPDTRLLEQRARLEFHYPKEDIIIFIPFYENPEISESKSANLVEYNPLGRTGSLFAYTGAKSRKIKVKVSYTLPHLERFDMGIDKFRRLIAGNTKESAKRLFTKWSEYVPESSLEVGGSVSFEAEKRYLRILEDHKSLEGQFGDLDSILNPKEVLMNTGIDITTEDFLEGLDSSQRHKVMDTLIFFVNIFRTSVDNDASNPIYGPPLIRLTFGTMYQSVPCICKSVNISYEEGMGYHLETLTPRRLSVDLDLAEVRVGDFGKYVPATIVQRDNLTGWESVIDHPLTIDPGQLE